MFILRRWPFILILLVLSLVSSCSTTNANDRSAEKPNIVFAFADDWGRHASAYGTTCINTAGFDQVAKKGVLFHQAYAPAPSCTPSRGAVLTGQQIWRLGPGANLHSTLPEQLPVYTNMLREKAGYFVGRTGKGWGPGNPRAGGREQNPAGRGFTNFSNFLDARPVDKPFCFWFGSSDPHRGYDSKLRNAFNISPEQVTVPPELPDVPAVRRDIANYLAEVKRFNREVKRIYNKLRDIGELQNTILVVSGDHGWPFPRGKSNLYDAGSRVPLAIMWPDRVPGKREVTDFVSLTDLAPTFLEAAGVSLPEEMTGDSLLSLLTSGEEGRVTEARDFVITAKERHHGRCRPGNTGYPSRAIRTDEYLYIRNYKPDRWPAGSPFISSSQNIFSDTDAGPTKRWMIKNADDPEVRPLFKQSFGKRPAEELYVLSEDPHQMNNVADHEKYREVKKRLSRKLNERLRAMDDPRVRGNGDRFDEYPYHTGYGSKNVDPPESVRNALNLDHR